MTALVVLIFIGIWILIIHGISYLIVKYLVPEGRRVRWYFGLLIFFMFGTFADEFLDQYQKREMCKPENLLIFDPEKVRGKTVVLRKTSKNLHKIDPTLTNTITFDWEDVKTQKLLITYKKIIFRGGWISRLIGGVKSQPITHRGTCGPIQPIAQLRNNYSVKFIYK